MVMLAPHLLVRACRVLNDARCCYEEARFTFLSTMVYPLRQLGSLPYSHYWLGHFSSRLFCSSAGSCPMQAPASMPSVAQATMLDRRAITIPPMGVKKCCRLSGFLVDVGIRGRAK